MSDRVRDALLKLVDAVEGHAHDEIFEAVHAAREALGSAPVSMRYPSTASGLLATEGNAMTDEQLIEWLQSQFNVPIAQNARAEDQAAWAEVCYRLRAMDFWSTT